MFSLLADLVYLSSDTLLFCTTKTEFLRTAEMQTAS